MVTHLWLPQMVIDLSSSSDGDSLVASFRRVITLVASSEGNSLVVSSEGDSLVASLGW